MISTEEQHELEPEGSKEVFPIKLNEKDLENSPFPSETDRAYVVEFLQKSFGNMWGTMPEGEKKDEIERNMEQGLAEVKEMMGEAWESLSNVQKRELFHRLFIERAEKLEERGTAPSEPTAPEAEAEAQEPLEPEKNAPETEPTEKLSVIEAENVPTPEPQAVQPSAEEERVEELPKDEPESVAIPEPEVPAPDETGEEKKEFPGFGQWVEDHSGVSLFTTDWPERRKQYLAEKKAFEEQTNT